MRVFVAVWPSPPVARQLAAIDRPARRDIRWTTKDQWHVTLRFLGEIGEEEVERVKGALGGLRSLEVGAAGRFRSVTALAGPALVRLGPSVLCLPVAGLDELAAAVVARTSDLGAPVPERPFRGHLTIARAARGVNPMPPAPVPFSAGWEVEDVTLVASTLHPKGARYEVIGRHCLSSKV